MTSIPLVPTTGFAAGSAGVGVRFVQGLLAGAVTAPDGFIPDGEHGDNTTAMLRDYQSISNLDVTGHCDPETMAEFEKDSGFKFADLFHRDGEVTTYVPIPPAEDEA